MKKRIRICGLVLVFALMLNLFSVCAFALEPAQTKLAEHYNFAEQTLEQIMAQFMEENGLTEEIFSLSYYAPGLEETYHFAEHTYRAAGSMYKLALNMYYYDLEREGEIDPEMILTEHRKADDESEEPLQEWPLSEAHYETIIHSDNDMAIAMLYNLGTFYEYRVLMQRYSDQSYANEYYWNNVINTNYMLDVLKYLNENHQLYPELMENLRKAAPWFLFKQYVDYPIAHKYGMFEGAYCDAGIIFSGEPFYLVAMIQLPYEEETEGEEQTLPKEQPDEEAQIDGAEVIARVAELLSAYTDYRTENRELPPEEPPAEEPPVEEPLPTEKPELTPKQKPSTRKPAFRPTCHE